MCRAESVRFTGHCTVVGPQCAASDSSELEVSRWLLAFWKNLWAHVLLSSSGESSKGDPEDFIYRISRPIRRTVIFFVRYFRKKLMMNVF